MWTENKQSKTMKSKTYLRLISLLDELVCTFWNLLFQLINNSKLYIKLRLLKCLPYPASLLNKINKDIKYKIWYCNVKALQKLDESVVSLST